MCARAPNEGGRMRARLPVTETIKASDVRANRSGVLNSVFRGERRVVVEKSGIPVAAVISTHDLERLTQLEAARYEAFKPIFETSEAFADVPAGELERQVARAIRGCQPWHPARLRFVASLPRAVA